MWIMADKALAVPIGTVKHRVFLGLMTLRTEAASRGQQGNRCFVFFRDGLVARLATHADGRVDKLALLLLRMAGQTRLRLYVLWFKQGMLDGFFSINLKWCQEKDA
jgi:hypothetical protein